jgi:hypothetical protein
MSSFPIEKATSDCYSNKIFNAVLREDLPFTPTARQIDVFLSDLGLVSPYLMAGSLKEVRAGIVGSILV